tara:strand:+ start:157 stop:372 length:216 start_codon:yes stop_codon:yes gene_type:complete
MYLERNIMNKRLFIAEEEAAKEEAAKNLKKIESHEIAWQLNRVANALEEVLRLVKEDQERSRKYMEEKKDD